MTGVFGGGATAKEWEFVVDVYDFGADGVLASVETPALEDNFEYLVTFSALSHNNGSSRAFEYELYGAVDGAYSPGLDVTALVSNSIVNDGAILFPTIRAAVSVHPGYIGRDITTGTQARSLAQAFATAQKIDKIRLSFGAGSLDAGAIRLYRRAL